MNSLSIYFGYDMTRNKTQTKINMIISLYRYKPDYRTVLENLECEGFVRVERGQQHIKPVRLTEGQRLPPRIEHGVLEIPVTKITIIILNKIRIL